MGTRMAKLGGILQEVSGEELARQTGLEAPPTSPLGMQGIGASQDVAKMAGTGEQVRATIRETLKERTDTRDVMGEAERSATRGRFDVAKIQQQLQTLSGVGSLDNRVAELVRARLTGAGTEPVSFTNDVDLKQVETQIRLNNPLIKPEELTAALASAQATLTALRDTPTATNVVAVLNSLGIKATINDSASDLATKLAQTNVFKQATVQDIKNKLDNTASLTKDLKVKDLQTVDFDKTMAATVLGVKPDELENMTLAEVKAQLAAYRSDTFSDLDELREALANPFSSQAQKDFARKRLAELGAVGVTSIEEKTDNLQAQMEEGDTVKVGNRQVKVADITTDPGLRATVATALDSPDEMTKLEKVDPELAKWIKTNQAALKQVKDQLTAGLGGFAANQKQYKDYLGATSPDLLDKLIPGWRDAKDTAFTDWKSSTAKSAPALVHVLDNVPKDKQDFVLAALATLPASTAKTFSTTILDSIAINADSGEEATSLLRSYQDTENKDWIASISEPAAPAFDADFAQADYDALVGPALKAFAPGFGSVKDLVDKINQLRVSANVADRQQAKDLSAQLANVKGELARTATPEKIQSIKDKNKTGKQETAFKEATTFVDTTIGNITKSLSGRGGDHLATRGAEVFSNIKSELAQLPMKVQLGEISLEEAKNQANALKGRMGAELGAFIDDKNHLVKNTPAALDAVDLILSSNLLQSMSPGDRDLLKKNLDAAISFSRDMAKKTFYPDHWNGLADRAEALRSRV